VERKRGERYSQKFRGQTVERMNACENILRLSRELGIHCRLLYKWRDQLEPTEAEGELPAQNSRESTLRKEVSKLKRLLADKTVEMDFFRSALQKVRARRQQNDVSGEKASTKKCETRLQGNLSIERMCQLAQVSRAGFYRYLRRGWQWEEEVALRSTVQDVVIEHRWCYGYRRVSEELRAGGMIVNHKRIARIMREDNLLVVRQDRSRPRRHTLHAARVYLNLATRMTLLGPNQLWVADERVFGFGHANPPKPNTELRRFLRICS
jgi:transposase-like protein